MRYYRLVGSNGEHRLGVEIRDGVLSDLTSVDEDLNDVSELVKTSSLSGLNIDEVAQHVLNKGVPITHDLGELADVTRRGEGHPWLDRPFDPPEVWAAGVTYKSSEIERRRESDVPDVYAKVYSADRPELFMKSTSDRCMGPFDSIGIRQDSNWNVPEPELAFVLFNGNIIGYTIGNDVSSRDIEGENPLYLPQAKMYNMSCAIGPCLVTHETISDPQNLRIRCSVYRNGAGAYTGETSTSLMARNCDELADWLQRYNTVPDMTTVLTGTAIIPPPDFTLMPEDVVTICIDEIGVLENVVLQIEG